MPKIDVVQGLLEGRRVGAYTYYVGLRVRSRTDNSVFGDQVETGTIRGFHRELKHIAMVELDNKAKLLLGATHGRYRLCAIAGLVPLDY